MNVLHVTPAFYPAHIYGGPIESVYQLCRHLGQAGCNVRVLTTDANGPDKVLNVETNREIGMGNNLHVRYCKRLIRHSVSPRLMGLLPRYVSWADIVHLTSGYSFPTIPTLTACRILGKPLVWSPRGSFQRWDGSRRVGLKKVWEQICKTVAPHALIIHATSGREAQSAQERFIRSDVVLIPNGVKIPEHVVRSDGETRSLRMLYLGRLDPIKGIENLLVACRKIYRDEGPAWFLTIAGVGEARYVASLKSLISELGIQQQVQMVGEVKRDSIGPLFERADLVVVPSYSENFGMVVAEALAHGVPVIASKGTPWSGLEKHECGLWVDNTPDSLAAAVQSLKEADLPRMGIAGREWMKESYSWEVTAAQMYKSYQSIM